MTHVNLRLDEINFPLHKSNSIRSNEVSYQNDKPIEPFYLFFVKPREFFKKALKCSW